MLGGGCCCPSCLLIPDVRLSQVLLGKPDLPCLSFAHMSVVVGLLRCSEQHYRPLVDLYWGGGMDPPAGYPTLAAVASAQYSGVNVTSREEGVEAIADNLARHTYEATCQVGL